MQQRVVTLLLLSALVACENEPSSLLHPSEELHVDDEGGSDESDEEEWDAGVDHSHLGRDGGASPPPDAGLEPPGVARRCDRALSPPTCGEAGTICDPTDTGDASADMVAARALTVGQAVVVQVAYREPMFASTTTREFGFWVDGDLDQSTGIVPWYGGSKTYDFGIIGGWTHQMEAPTVAYASAPLQGCTDFVVNNDAAIVEYHVDASMVSSGIARVWLWSNHGGSQGLADRIPDDSDGFIELPIVGANETDVSCSAVCLSP